MIALVDYGAGNLTSVRKALAHIGAEVWTPVTPDELSQAHGIIVPGVGHFDATAALDAPWRDAIVAALSRQVPLLGICVGLQWLFEGSDEAPGVRGLALIPGRCVLLGNASNGPAEKLGNGDRLKVPHVGWNSLAFPRSTRLFAGIPDGTQVYFTHSYAAPVVNSAAAFTTYGRPFSAAVEDGLVSGVQFHPEKSGAAGLQVLRNWLGTVHAV